MDELYLKYSNFDPLFAVPGNFLDEVMQWTKEILNWLDREETNPVYHGLRKVFNHFNNVEDIDMVETDGSVNTKTMLDILDFLRLPNDVCSRIIKDC